MQAPFLYSAFTDFLQNHMRYGKPKENDSSKENSIISKGQKIMTANIL